MWGTVAHSKTAPHDPHLPGAGAETQECTPWAAAPAGAGGCVLQVGWDWETPLGSHTTLSPFLPRSFPAAPSPGGPRRRLLGPPPALALKLCK